MEAHYEQFIGHYPAAVSAQKCNQIINYFEEMTEIQKSYSRQDSEGVSKLVKKDNAIMSGMPKSVNENLSFIVGATDPTTLIVSEELSHCVNHYVDTFDALEQHSMMALYHKVQKTLPSGGYHVWHHEQGGGAQMRRLLVYTVYLNTVNEGGETEFLYQQKRYPAKQGDVCIFPAHFTHVHRGNPPLSGEKYIMTGWVESVNLPDNMG